MPSIEILTRSFQLAIVTLDQPWAERLLAQGADWAACKNAALASETSDIGLRALERHGARWASEDYLRPTTRPRHTGPWDSELTLAPKTTLAFLLGRKITPPPLAVELAARLPHSDPLFAAMARANPCKAPGALAAACAMSDPDKALLMLSLGWSAQAEFKGRSMLEWCFAHDENPPERVDRCALLLINALDQPAVRSVGALRGDAGVAGESQSANEQELARRVIRQRLPLSAGALLEQWRGSAKGSSAQMAWAALFRQKQRFAPFVEREELLRGPLASSFEPSRVKPRL